MPSKNIIKSKTFWFNVLGIIGTVAGAIPVTPATIIIGGVANLILRVLTNKEVTIVPTPAPDVPSVPQG